MKTAFKRSLSIILSVALLCTMIPFVSLISNAADENIPSQDANGYYVIENDAQFNYIVNFINQGNYGVNVLLNTNVAYTADSPIGSMTKTTRDWHNGYSVTDITAYTGVFDGKGHTITMPLNISLFAAIDGAEIKNTRVTGANRAIVDYMASGTLYQLFNESETVNDYIGNQIIDNSSRYVGGIVNIVGADSHTGTTDKQSVISGCVNTAVVDAPWDVGGIAGAARGSNILFEGCCNKGKLKLDSGRNAAGIVSYTSSGVTVRNCFDCSQRESVYDENNGISGTGNS